MNLWSKIKANRAVSIILETSNSFGDDNGSLLAAAVAYNLLFSIFPFALALISIAGFFMSSPRFEQQVINALGNLLPVAREMLAKNLHEVVNARAETGLIALAAFIWSSSSFFDAIRGSLNKAWGIKTGVSFLKGRIINIAMLMGAFILMLGYIWLSTGIRVIHTARYHSEDLMFLNSTTTSATVFAIVNSLMAFLLILLLYKYVPTHRPQWRDIWPGALLAAASIEIVRYGFIWYMRNVGNYNLVYGSVGAVIALLTFIYVSAWALLFFAEMSATVWRLRSNSSNHT
jgi:membrane protein